MRAFFVVGREMCGIDAGEVEKEEEEKFKYLARKSISEFEVSLLVCRELQSGRKCECK